MFGLTFPVCVWVIPTTAGAQNALLNGDVGIIIRVNYIDTVYEVT